jgi:hypothetical protein
METITTRANYDLRDLMDEHLTTSNLVTRETGRSMRELIELRLEREPEGAVVALDFSHVALERKKLAVLVSRPDGSWRLLGSLNPYLNEALQFVMNQKEITARDLADDTQVEISLASTKLLNLFKARLVQRSSERLPDGGRQFIYRSLFVER